MSEHLTAKPEVSPLLSAGYCRTFALRVDSPVSWRHSGFGASFLLESGWLIPGWTRPPGLGFPALGEEGFPRLEQIEGITIISEEFSTNHCHSLYKYGS